MEQQETIYIPITNGPTQALVAHPGHNSNSPRPARSSMVSSGCLAVSRRGSSQAMEPSQPARGQSQVKTSPSSSETTKPPSSTNSLLRPSALQARFDLLSAREVELERSLEETSQEIRSCDAKILELEEDRSVGMGICDKRQRDVEAARKAYEEAGAFFKRQQDVLTDALKDVENLSSQLKQAWTLLANSKTRITALEEEQVSVQQAKERVRRQANRLEMDKDEVDVLVQLARSNKPFLANLHSVVEGSATEATVKDIKTMLFDALTCVNQDELKELVETILITGQTQDIDASSRNAEEACEEGEGEVEEQEVEEQEVEEQEAEETTEADSVGAAQPAAVEPSPSSRGTSTEERDLAASQSRIITLHYSPDSRGETRRRRASPTPGHRDKRPRREHIMPRSISRESSLQRRQRS